MATGCRGSGEDATRGLVKRNPKATLRQEPEMVVELSRRQTQVLVFVADGLTNDEIGQRLGISARTARSHVDALKQKLGVARRREVPSAYHRLTGLNPFDH